MYNKIKGMDESERKNKGIIGERKGKRKDKDPTV